MNNMNLSKFLENIQIIEKDLITIFEKNNIKKINCLKEKFDPNNHQAMLEIEDDTVSSGTVLQEIQPGYFYKDRLLRPSFVAIAKKKDNKTDKKEEIRDIFKSFLGPIGKREFNELDTQNKLGLKELINYINLIKKEKVIDQEQAEEFVDNLYLISGETHKKIEKRVIRKGIEKEIKDIYIEIIGKKKGEFYFNKVKSNMDLKIMIPQIDLLFARSIITKEKSEEFKYKLRLILK